MKMNLLTRAFVVLVAAAPIIGCSGASVTAPSASITTSSTDEFTLRGTVVDMDNRPEGIAVMLSNGVKQRATVTDANGDFIVDKLAPGDWILILSKAGYDDAIQQVNVNGDITLKCSLGPIEIPAKPAKPLGSRRK
jgi:hypothetical protein